MKQVAKIWQPLDRSKDFNGIIYVVNIGSDFDIAPVFDQECSFEMYLGSGLDFGGLWPLVEAFSGYFLEICYLVLG